jgi:hypothetical protein
MRPAPVVDAYDLLRTKEGIFVEVWRALKSKKADAA